MGGGASKGKKGGKGGKGAPPPPPPPPPAADPRLPLTIRQKFSIVKSWKGISRAMESTGVYMFVKLFEEHQELLGFFSKLKGLKEKDKEAQAESLELQEHATVVMNTLDEAIRALEDVDAFLVLLHHVGATHAKIPGYDKEFFWKIRGPFLEAVKVTLGDAYTENMDTIYKITIDFILQTLIDGFEKGSS